ncbi:MAG: hypothetical protein KC496_21155, partial [Anaerolineae bacterium]|nr:hypothetical protein [Anaerolineae bacterium]
MELTREVQRLALSFLVLFALIGSAATYWATFGADSILLREDNPRTVEDEAAIRRGGLYPRNENTPLAATVENDDGSLTRIYYDPASYSYTGYFSLRYGVGGAEAAYDPLLRGETDRSLETYFQQEILHLPQVGLDVQLTLDSRIQQHLYEALNGMRGAAVVLRVPDGAVAAMVSLPTYDPNVLDEQWETLIEAEGNPFFNRAVQGQYQPGGLIQTSLVGLALLQQESLSAIQAGATEPVTINNLSLTCALAPPSDSLTLQQAYAYSCPTPFLQLAQVIPQNTIEESFMRLSRIGTPRLEGFIPDNPEVERTPEATASITATYEEWLLGQGQLTVSPLGIASATGALINAGNAPLPYTLSAIREPGSEWNNQPHIAQTLPLTTETIARRLREQMQNNLRVLGTAIPDGTTIGGHVALSYSGEETQAWFTGFILLEGGR